MKTTSLFLSVAAIFVAIAPGCLAGSDSGGEHTDNQDDSLEACTGDSVVEGDGRKDVAWYEAWNNNGITIGLAR